MSVDFCGSRSWLDKRRETRRWEESNETSIEQTTLPFRGQPSQTFGILLLLISTLNEQTWIARRPSQTGVTARITNNLPRENGAAHRFTSPCTLVQEVTSREDTLCLSSTSFLCLARFDGQGLRKRWRLHVVEMLQSRHESRAAAAGRATRFRRRERAAFWYATASRARIRHENTQKPRLGTPPEGLRFDGFTVRFDATLPKAQRDCATNGVAKNHITSNFSDPSKWRAHCWCPQA